MLKGANHLCFTFYDSYPGRKGAMGMLSTLKSDFLEASTVPHVLNT